MRHIVVGTVLTASLIGAATAAAVAARPVAGSAVLATAAAPGGALGSTSVVRVAFDGAERAYRLFVPAVLPPGPRPLLVALHGYTSTAAGMEAMTRLDEGATAAGALVAYPDGSHRSWDAGTCCGRAVPGRVDDVGFLAAVLDDVRARAAVDARRVAVGGFSNGGMMSYRFACERPQRVSAVVAMSATTVTPSCGLTRPVSVLAVHGLDDPVVPFRGLMRSSLDPSGFRPVWVALDRIASADGCAGWSPARHVGAVSTYDARRCVDGSVVRLVTSASLGHHWPVGTHDEAAYGLDMSRLTWQFLTAVWARP